jgi:hypothetical protein
MEQKQNNIHGSKKFNISIQFKYFKIMLSHDKDLHLIEGFELGNGIKLSLWMM